MRYARTVSAPAKSNRVEKFHQHTALNWTEAQKKQTEKYQPGQILAFHKAVKGVAKNEALEVVSADQSAITARKATGEILQITNRQAKAFGVFEKQDLEISAGDKLLLQANWRDKRFRATNGELVTVASVESGSIQLKTAAGCLPGTGSLPTAMRSPRIAARARRSISKSSPPSAWRRICSTFPRHAHAKG